MKFRCIVVEDEINPRQQIIEDLEIFKEFEMLDWACDADKAYELIVLHKPDLVFLDNKLAGAGNGISVIERCKNNSVQIPKIVFLTAFDQYGAEALERDFGEYILDYVMKGDADVKRHARLRVILDRLIARKSSAVIADVFEGSIWLSKAHERERVPIKEIIWISVEQHWIKIHTDRGVYNEKESLKNFLARLPEEHFIQVRRDHAVNVHRVISVSPSAGHLGVMENGILRKIPFGEGEFKKEVQTRFSNKGK